MTERFVVLGLAPARSQWFRNVAQWANDGSVGLHFVKCVSAVELRAHLASARPFSAAMIDSTSGVIDRDLIDEARTAGIAVLVVDDGRARRDWLDLGAAAVLSPVMSRDELAETISRHAAPVGEDQRMPGDAPMQPHAGLRAEVTVVCGTGGVGSSTVAMAVAQCLGDDPDLGGMVLLVDGARRAELAMLHDAGDVVPGIQELVDLHRGGRPTLDQVRQMTFAVPTRRYDLLLGLRRPHHWSALRPRAVDATFESLLRGWRAVVVDADGDAEPVALTGSEDVERRAVLSRTAMWRATRVLVVGSATMKGIYSLGRLIHELIDAGTRSRQLIPVVNRAPRNPVQRAALARTLGQVVGGDTPLALAGPVFVAEHRRLEAAIRDAARIPAVIADAVRGVTGLEIAGHPSAQDPERIKPGSLGSWVETA